MAKNLRGFMSKNNAQTAAAVAAPLYSRNNDDHHDPHSSIMVRPRINRARPASRAKSHEKRPVRCSPSPDPSRTCAPYLLAASASAAAVLLPRHPSLSRPSPAPPRTPLPPPTGARGLAAAAWPSACRSRQLRHRRRSPVFYGVGSSPRRQRRRRRRRRNLCRSGASGSLAPPQGPPGERSADRVISDTHGCVQIGKGGNNGCRRDELGKTARSHTHTAAAATKLSQSLTCGLRGASWGGLPRR